MSLRKLCAKDAPGMLEWMNDREIQKNFFHITSRTQKEVLEFISRAQNDSECPQDGKDIHFAIVDENDEYLGTVSLKKINLSAGNAEFAIAMRKKAQGTGAASKAVGELLKMAFDDYGLQRVYLNVLSENRRAVRLYEKCGFVFEGEFRKHLCVHGRLQSLKWYAMLKEDYAKMVSAGCRGN